jgi:hypothetical protein
VGIVARAGLGGGKGSHDGESESAETVSTKPTINFIVDMVNTLCRQHYGMDKNITFNITNDSSSTDQLNRYKALSTAVNGGMLTLNDVRGELSMPLFDMEEADEPFIMAAGGPTFLKGQLEVDAQGETVAQTGPSSDKTNQDKVPQKQDPKSQTSPTKEDKGGDSGTTPTPSVEADKSVQAEEFREFAKFVKSRNKTGKWRAFDFVTVQEEVADKLNNEAYFLVKGAVPMPDSVLAWAEDVVKAQISDNTKGLATKAKSDRRKEVANYYAPKIQKAIADSFSGVPEAIKEVLGTQTKADQDPKKVAAKAVKKNIKIKSDSLSKQLDGVHNDGALVGAEVAAAQLGTVAVTDTGVASLIKDFDWSNWKPGNPVAAERVAGKQFKKVLKDRQITLEGINDTSLTRIGNALADALSTGASYAEAAFAINEIINDPERAMIIAQTESNFAFNATTIDTYTDSGIEEYDWKAYDPCILCQEQEDSSPHQIGDEIPPLHPNCMCYITAIIPSLTDSTGE